MAQKLIVLWGLPRSGKTTYYNKFLNHLPLYQFRAGKDDFPWNEIVRGKSVVVEAHGFYSKRQWKDFGESLRILRQVEIEVVIVENTYSAVQNRGANPEILQKIQKVFFRPKLFMGFDKITRVMGTGRMGKLAK